LSRLEQTVSLLVERLDRGDARGWEPEASNAPSNNPPHINNSPPGTPSAAPMFLIRDVASQVGVRQQQPPSFQSAASQSRDVISKGMLTLQEASGMIELYVPIQVLFLVLTHFRFQEHYGRWVSFSATIPLPALVVEIRKSPLLLCACCLIAVRHTTQDSASVFARQLFQDAKALLCASLLDVPQSIEFFQAALILSMWSTTIGQTPLSIDSWLLSGFALQHSLASDIWGPITNVKNSNTLSKSELDRWCIWNHLCLVHLQ
jgi:hypothetical protein